MPRNLHFLGDIFKKFAFLVCPEKFCELQEEPHFHFSATQTETSFLENMAMSENLTIGRHLSEKGSMLKA